MKQRSLFNALDREHKEDSSRSEREETMVGRDQGISSRQEVEERLEPEELSGGLLQSSEEPVLIVIPEEGSGRSSVSLTSLALLNGLQVLVDVPDCCVWVLDGGNSFDPYVVSRTARRLGIPPDRVLNRLKVSRAFTCHQMWSLICEKLADRQQEGDLPEAVLILDLLRTFYDEDVSRAEALYLLKDCKETIEVVSKQTSLILTEHPPPEEASGRADFQQRLGTVCPLRVAPRVS